MMKKMVSILIITLMIGATILPVAGSMSVKTSPFMVLGVVDQQQPDISEEYFLDNYKIHTQEFVNQGNTIEKVEVYIAHYYSGSEPMTLSIEKPLGNKITFATLTTASIPDHAPDWCTFDFPDAPLQKGEKYYIVIQFDCCSEYTWHGAHGDPYPLGGSSHPDIDWDFAFRTIVDKKSKTRNVNTPFLNLLENYLILFPILQKIIYRLGLQ